MQELLQRLAEYPIVIQMVILAAMTLISEDGTTITAGILISEGAISPITAFLGCFFGIFIGDGLLYLLGLVVGRPALKLPILKRMMTEEQVDHCARWFEENGLIVILTSRFLPGARLPTYFAAGLVGSSAAYFLVASAIAVAIWTPLLLFAAWYFGDALKDLMRAHEHYYWPVMAGSILLMIVLVRLFLKLGSWRMRARIRSRMRRWTHWEFWPTNLVYIPILCYNIWLALRHRCLNYPLVSNPGIEYSGFLGESKQKIMEALFAHPEFCAQFLDVEPNLALDQRIDKIHTWMAERHLAFPLMMKPDVGQRGDGVQRVNDRDELRAYLSTCSVAVQVQEFLPGPYEVGISYRRYPWEERGKVIGLTGKEFPRAVGDGVSNLHDLILRNPMAQGRIHIFTERFSHRLDEVLAPGEVLELVRAGNHCLGTHFNDSTYLLTPELSAKVDEISRAIPGFFIGRFDVRASHLEELRRGEKFKIMELNGASAEPSFIYDPRHSMIVVYKTLFAHYRDLWLIGAYNAQNGHPPPSIRVLLRQVMRYRKLAKGQADVH